MTILIGTRGSKLAVTQAEQVRLSIASLFPDEELLLEVVRTMGDRLSASDQVPDGSGPPPGVFTKELDEALLSGRIRAAIHSLKDVPTVLPEGVAFGAYIQREDPRDALVSAAGKGLMELPPGSGVGTSSPRRQAQIRAARPDLRVLPLQGNVDTRLSKVGTGVMDAIVLAAAGLRRLGREKEITEFLPVETMLPAPAQGVLCVTVRGNDREWSERLQTLDHPGTRTCAEAERAFLRKLQGGCRVPVGALASFEGDRLVLRGVIARADGGSVMRESSTGSPDQPVLLGETLAKRFLEMGASEILRGYGRTF